MSESLKVGGWMGSVALRNVKSSLKDLFFWHKWEFRRFYERFDVIKQIDESGKESKSLIEILTFFPVDICTVHN